jgi:rRNA maturation endonuclease Nob1
MQNFNLPVVSILAREDTKQLRKTICEDCPSKISRLNMDVCSECGCALRAKLIIAKSACPLGKWGKE